MNFLFWNINGKNLSRSIENICNEYDVDILGICEGNDLDVNYIKNMLNMEEAVIINDLTGRGIKLFFKKVISIDVNNENEKYHKEFTLNLNEISYRLIVVHLPSKLSIERLEQSLLCTRFQKILVNGDNKNEKTIIFGDFNMNPFEEGIISSEAFHAINYKEKSLKQKRTVYGEKRHLFFNPTWFLYANHYTKPIGSYFYESNSPMELFWNMFDQVIISPDLIDFFDFENFKIIDKILTENLCRNGTPNKTIYSDHLPILFKINL